MIVTALLRQRDVALAAMDLVEVKRLDDLYNRMSHPVTIAVNINLICEEGESTCVSVTMSDR